MTNPTIKDMTTKELLNAKTSLAPGEFRDGDGHLRGTDLVAIGHRVVSGGKVVEVKATRAEIINELNTRPHVPSKKEAQVIRQLKAQTHQSEEWLRAHPKYWQKIVDVSYPNRRAVTKQEYEKLARQHGNDVFKYYKIGE